MKKVLLGDKMKIPRLKGAWESIGLSEQFRDRLSITRK